MRKKVFLSYSWKDRQIAMRLHGDLSRSNVLIWRDQIDGNPIADFEKEFLLRIDECDYFIMLDSINYREKSNWCCKEIERCLENQRKNHKTQIIVCLLTPDGEWRTNYRDSDSKMIFEQVNKLKYQKLFYNGYDDYNVYDNTVNFICSLLGTCYERFDKIPSYQDLMDELGNEYEKKPFDETTANIILGGYKNILYKIEKSYQTVMDSFKIWIKDCEESDISMFFPKWTFSVWLMNQMAIDKGEIFKLLHEITQAFPDDPRGYRALGCFSAYIGNEANDDNMDPDVQSYYYNIAKEALLKAENLLNRPEKQRQKSVCYFEVLTNIGKVYSILKDDRNAILYWDRALSIMKMDNFFYESLVSDLFLTLKTLNYSTNALCEWLYALLRQYPLEPILYQLLGLMMCEIGKVDIACNMIEKAYSINPCAENLYYLTNIKLVSGTADLNEIIQLCNTGNWDDDDITWIEEIKEAIIRRL